MTTAAPSTGLCAKAARSFAAATLSPRATTAGVLDPRTATARIARTHCRGTFVTMGLCEWLAQSVLPNGGFYQAAAALLGILLLTSVVTEVRVARDRREGWETDRWLRLSVYGFLCLSLVVLVGELATMTVLLRQSASPVLQAVVGASLILGLVGVPGLALVGVMRDIVGSANVSRWLRGAALYTAITAALVVGAFVLPSALTHQAGVGTPTPPSSSPHFGRAETSGPLETATPDSQEAIQCAHLPRDPSVPATLARALRSLWYGPGTFGTQIAGCPGRIQIVSGRRAAIAVGLDPRSMDPLSLGVAGPSGAGLLLGEAASIARTLFSREGALGASKRIDVEDGDLYLLYTYSGTILLIRRDLTNRYVVLPPPVAAYWHELIKERGEWLWPQPSTAGEFAFASDESDHAVAAARCFSADNCDSDTSNTHVLLTPSKFTLAQILPFAPQVYE